MINNITWLNYDSSCYSAFGARCRRAQSRVKASERYVLRWKTVKVKVANYSSEKCDLWLWDSKRKRVLWKRRLDDFDAAADKKRVHWSKDHRALAIECIITDNSDNTPWRVLVWREGFRLRDFRAPNHEDYTMGCVWSPDKQRLLVLAGGSGASSTGVGTLHCLQLKSWPDYKLSKLGLASDFKWRNRKTVIFWGLIQDAVKPPQLTPPRFWHTP